MRAVVEALGFHAGAEVHEYQGNRQSNHEYISQVLDDLKTPADLKKAVSYRDHNSLRKWENNIPRPFNIFFSSISHFAEYSIGLRLHFLLIKQLIIVFFVIALTSILPLYLNYTGDYFTGAQTQSQLDYFTIGNQYGIRPNVTGTLDINKNQENYLMVWASDVACSGYFLLMILIFFIYAFVSVRKSMLTTPRISDYAIEVKGIPRLGVNKDEIKEFFSKRFGEVVEVFLGRRYYDLLYCYTLRAQVIEEIRIREAYITFNELKKDTDKQLLKLKVKQDKLDKKIAKDSKIQTHDELEIKRAYVVFNDKQDKINCLKQYNKRRCCCCNYQEKSYRFNGTAKLQVFPTNEPSDIIWENLEVGKCSRFFRVLASYFFTLLILLFSIGMIYYVKTTQSNLPANGACPSNSPPPPIGTSKSDILTLCYCQGLSYNDMLQKAGGTCSTYFGYLSFSWSMKFLSSFGIILVNFFLKLILRILSSFERPKSRSEIQIKIFKKVLVLMFINTAILTYIINLAFDVPGSIINTGDYNDFTRTWYLRVGSLIMILMIISLGSPHLIFLLIAYPLGVLRRNCCLESKKHKKSQYEMNLRFIGPEFDMAGKTAQILNVIFTSYLYSGGIPLLNCTCFIYLIVVYYTDKFLVLRHYRSPSYSNQDLYMSTFKILPLAVIFHCCFALYMHGNPDIFTVDYKANVALTSIFGDTIAPRIEKASGIFNCFLILSAVFLIILLNFLDAVFNCFVKRIKTYSKTDKKFSEIREILKRSGLDSYDIRQNPSYAMIINAMDDSITLRDIENLDDNLGKTSDRNKTGICISLENKSNDKVLFEKDEVISSSSDSSSPEFSRDTTSKIKINVKQYVDVNDNEEIPKKIKHTREISSEELVSEPDPTEKSGDDSDESHDSEGIILSDKSKKSSASSLSNDEKN